MKGDPAAGALRVWDLPVRITHWCFALAIPALWWTAENDEMGWHMRIGIALLALLVFRLLWGLVGSSTARFSGFVKGPGAVASYLLGKTGSWPQRIGHNPAGGWSVLALLFLMSLQVFLGLFAGDEDDGVTGPLNSLVSYGNANRATEWHETNFYILLGFVGLHLAAIAWYRIGKRQNLVTPMVTGKQPVTEGASDMIAAPAWRAIACAITAALAAWWIWTGAPPFG